MSKFIYVKESKFYCKICDTPLTLFSENKGEGFRTRCYNCQKIYYYPTCDICNQPTWKHDIEICATALAKATGKWYCRKCKIAKDITEFNAKGDTISSRCKKCQAEYFKSWYESTRQPKNKNTDVDVSDFLDEIFGVK